MDTSTLAEEYPNLVKQYEIVKQIGDGGFSLIYQVVRHTDKMVFACKTNTWGFKGKALGEAEIMNCLKGQPSVVQLIETIQDDGYCHLIMELCVSNVGDFVFPEDQAAVVVRKVAGVLDVMHKLKIAHLDIKPDNILLGRDGKVKVADFGMSLRQEGKQAMAMKGMVGTAKYISPEIERGEVYNERCDMWSLGITMYEMIKGSTHADVNVFDWSGVSELAKDLILSMLNLDINQRLTAAQVLKHPWVARTAVDLSSQGPCCLSSEPSGQLCH